MTEVILFDLGGVLVRLTGVPAMLEWTPGSLTETELWERWLRSDAVRAFESGRIEPARFADTIVTEFGLSVSPERFLHEFENWIDGLFDGVEDLLGDLRGQFRLATMSNTNAVHWPRLVGEMELGRLIDEHFPSHQTGLLKPDSEAFDNVVKSLDVPPDRILFLDDNDLNVVAARDRGLRAERTRGPADIKSHVTNHTIT